MSAYAGEIWVTGAGCVSAAGRNVDENMRGLYAGARPQSLPDIFPDAAERNPVCLVKDEWMREAGYPWRKHSAADSSSLALLAAREALDSASFAPAKGSRFGVAVGTVTGSSLYFFNTYKALRRGESPAAHEAPDFIYGNPAAVIANKYGVCGPRLTAANACTSGSDSIGSALEWLRIGMCDAALAGGADNLSFISYCGFNRLLIYSDEPCRPFDKARKGLNLGEGAGMLLLERSDKAKARGARPLAILLGYGAASDAHHFTAPSPEGRGLGEAVQKAMRQAGITPADLAFVNAHGTATLENDKAEGPLFARLLPGVPVWGSKGGTGHCLGAAGAVEAVFSVMALKNGLIPPTVGCAEPEDAVRQTIVLEPTPTNKKYALSVSAGFGGGNAVLVFGLPEDCAERSPGDSSAFCAEKEIFVVNGRERRDG